MIIATRSGRLPAVSPAHNAQDGAAMNKAASTVRTPLNSKYIRPFVRMLTTEGER